MASANPHVFGTEEYRVPRCPRTFLHTSAEVRCSAAPGIHVAIVRDVSATGIFFYSDFKPPLGAGLTLTVDNRTSGGNTRIRFEGKVVRVEQVRVGAAPGIALLLDNQKLAFTPDKSAQSKIA
jgi:PilZ domain